MQICNVFIGERILSVLYHYNVYKLISDYDFGQTLAT